MNIIYNKETGEIFSAISEGQDYKRYYRDWGEEFINNLASFKVENIPEPLGDYYIENEKIVKYSDIELLEIQQYGRVLTDEERQLNKLKPSLDEIRKAENTIEILTLIQEVI